MQLQDTVILVTGGANGIGREYCEQFAAHGARVVIADLAGEEGDRLAGKLNEQAGDVRAVSLRADVTSPADAQAMVTTAVDAFGRIDVLVNNVGTYPHTDFADITFDEWRSVMAVNLDSVFVCSQAVLPAMRERRQGKIINVATNLIWIGLPSMVHYIAAKAGVVGFTRALAREVGPDGITVNALAPGAVTPPVQYLSEESLARLESIVNHQAVKWCCRPNDLSGTMVFLASPMSDFMSGQVITVDGGLTTH